MYKFNDFKRLFVSDKVKAVPSGISIRKPCDSNKALNNLFEKWNKDTQQNWTGSSD